MKIKWTDGRKEIPKLGILNTGDIRDVSEDIGRAFIKQGQAKKVKGSRSFTGVHVLKESGKGGDD